MRKGCLILIVALVVMVQLHNYLNPKEEPPIERTPYAFDYVNGRPIFVEDTVYLMRHPYRFDQWIPKTELHKHMRTQKVPSIKDSALNAQVEFESQIEDVVNSMLQ
ncbi:hypothetical protein [Flavobacterium sp.]|jgi:hypothetical protein|uniref:hypothetical protein n=1 Tax=Flavobacterium sp. TaxID=239 RepID=UPI0037BF25D7